MRNPKLKSNLIRWSWTISAWLFLLLRAYGQPLVTSVDAIGLTVSDVDRSAEFFSRVLSFEKVSEFEIAGAEFEHLEGVFGARARIVRMRLGDEFIELTEYLTPKGKPVPIDSRSNDQWFQHIAIITSDMNKAYQWLRQNKVTHASTNPQRLPDWNVNAGGIQAFYFKDPDGHALEVLQFPAGKGAAKWHEAAARNKDRLFLGIDHTAIVVNDTASSLKFYRDWLGFKVAGESENYGTEQEHLNNVFGARLRITSLRAERGPGIEFLEYLAPRDGRLTPQDLKANDLAHWQTKLIVRDLKFAERGAISAHYTLVSSGIASLLESEQQYKKSLIVRDPDGHAMQLIEK
ncbi:MAG TPA: VOC family protein [Blastocatellia bacterium]|nr:VOC family protein [Blastocatellia bacterium]